MQLWKWIVFQGAIAGGLSSLVFMAWLCISAQSAIKSGDLTFPEKPVTTEGCHYHFTPKFSLNDVTYSSPINLTEITHTE